MCHGHKVELKFKLERERVKQIRTGGNLEHIKDGGAQAGRARRHQDQL